MAMRDEQSVGILEGFPYFFKWPTAILWAPAILQSLDGLAKRDL